MARQPANVPAASLHHDRLTFDQVGFFAALHVFLDLPLHAFLGGWIAKMAAALFYSVAAGLYLRWGEASTGSGRSAAG